MHLNWEIQLLNLWLLLKFSLFLQYLLQDPLFLDLFLDKWTLYLKVFSDFKFLLIKSINQLPWVFVTPTFNWHICIFIVYFIVLSCYWTQLQMLTLWSDLLLYYIINITWINIIRPALTLLLTYPCIHFPLFSFFHYTFIINFTLT